jgi:hypothetical protein
VYNFGKLAHFALYCFFNRKGRKGDAKFRKGLNHAGLRLAAVEAFAPLCVSFAVFAVNFFLQNMKVQQGFDKLSLTAGMDHFY